jgi:hypothetical protein
MWFKKREPEPKRPTLTTVTLRPCQCGCDEWYVGRNGFVDIVACRRCGAMHVVDDTIREPVARVDERA